MPLPKWAATLFDAVNIYRGAGYSPPTSNAKDFALQAVLTALALPIALFFIVQGMQGIVGVPLVTSTTILRPEPAQVQQLFAQLASGEISALSCPCSNSRTTLDSVSTWRALEDPYCAALREFSVNEELRRLFNISGIRPAFTFQDFFSAESIGDGFFCLGPTNGTNFNVFMAQVNESLVIPGALFSGIDSELQPRALLNLAFYLGQGLCGSAFGSIAPQAFSNSPSGISPTTLSSGCPLDAPTALPLPSFQPQFSAFLFSPGNFVQLQWTRAFNFLRQSAATCDILSSLREGFKDAIGQLPLITYSALSPQELGQTVERLWRNSLGERARQAAGLTPGFDVSERTSFLTEATPGLVDLNARVFNNFYNINPDDFAFSSRLPFSRADFLSTGTQFYYVAAPAADFALPTFFSAPLRYVEIVGQSRLMAAGDSTRNPALQYFRATPFRQLPLGTFGPPAPYAVNVGSYPIGDDLISLLDACSSGAALSIDVHNFRRVQDPRNISSALFPFDVMNYSETCNLGAGINSAETLDATVLFSVPVQCPRWLTWLGQARANSTFANVSSFKRRTYWEMRNSSQGFNAALQEMLEQSDFSDRADLLSTLFIRQNSTNFTHSDLNHYKTCAPSTCTFTRVKSRTLFEYGIEGLNVLGGTSYSVIAFLGCVLAWP